jgi:hypothetical protein
MATILLLAVLVPLGLAISDALGAPDVVGLVVGLGTAAALSRALLRWLSVRAAT